MWPIFKEYKVERVDGELFVSAVLRPLPSDLDDLREQMSVDHFYPPLYNYPDLFIRFARLPANSETQTEDEMVEVVLGWVRDYGILGVEGIDPLVQDGKRHGGRKEGVAAFARAVKEAAFVLDAFESASSNSPERMRDCSRQYMPTEMSVWPPDKIRATLLGNVADRVGEHVERDCYPSLLNTFGAFSQAWGFRSLLGAMYLQMMFYTLEPGMLRWCKATDCDNIVTFETGTPPESSRKGARGKYHTRADKVYCSKACAERMRYRRKSDRKDADIS